MNIKIISNLLFIAMLFSMRVFFASDDRMIGLLYAHQRFSFNWAMMFSTIFLWNSRKLSVLNQNDE